MWPQNYTPIGGNILLSALAAGIPLYVLFYLLAVRRLPGHVAAPASLLATLLTATLVFSMPAQLVASAALMGIAFALFPIMWIVLNAFYIYHLTLVSGRFSTVRASIASLSEDQRVQALLIAFAFGALMEGIAGFGTPVALSAAMLVGVGFSPFSAVSLALLANTAPVAFGNLGIPIISLAGVVQPFLGGTREQVTASLSAMVGRQVPLLSLLIPAFLVVVLAGWRRMMEAAPAVLTAGISFAGTQFLVANFIGPILADVAAALVAILALLLLLRLWRPATVWRLSTLEPTVGEANRATLAFRDIALGWGPFVVLVVVVVLGNVPAVAGLLDRATVNVPWPGLHNEVSRTPPLVGPLLTGTTGARVAAIYTFDWLRAAGTLALFAGLLSLAVLGVDPVKGARVYLRTAKGLLLPTLSVASVLSLAWVMNYSGMTVTLGLFFTFAGPLFPFFSAFIGWIGVFLTGSDTASNNLFGGLQVTTASLLGWPGTLTAATNSSGGVCAKMISPQNLAIGAASVGLSGKEGDILQRTVLWSLLLVCLVGALAMAQAYVVPFIIPSASGG